MTKEIKNILKKDLKKYQTLAEYSEGENRNIYLEVANCIENIFESE